MTESKALETYKQISKCKNHELTYSINTSACCGTRINAACTKCPYRHKVKNKIKNYPFAFDMRQDEIKQIYEINVDRVK